MLFQHWRTEPSPSTLPILNLILTKNCGARFRVNTAPVHYPAGISFHPTSTTNFPKVLETILVSFTTIYVCTTYATGLNPVGLMRLKPVGFTTPTQSTMAIGTAGVTFLHIR
ncbi:hypothetical protein BJ165DRAFT_1509479 [Panaeolus papilionaceus]|nr:hypothetical protein BJ165DRAFT_1509479 [Panaeolus papilionaceus]